MKDKLAEEVVMCKNSNAWNVIGRHSSQVHSCQHWKAMVACEPLVSICDYSRSFV